MQGPHQEAVKSTTTSFEPALDSSWGKASSSEMWRTDMVVVEVEGNQEDVLKVPKSDFFSYLDISQL